MSKFRMPIKKECQPEQILFLKCAVYAFQVLHVWNDHQEESLVQIPDFLNDLCKAYHELVSACSPVLFPALPTPEHTSNFVSPRSLCCRLCPKLESLTVSRDPSTLMRVWCSRLYQINGGMNKEESWPDNELFLLFLLTWMLITYFTRYSVIKKHLL